MLGQPNDELLAELVGYKPSLNKYWRVFLYHAQIDDGLRRRSRRRCTLPTRGLSTMPCASTRSRCPSRSAFGLHDDEGRAILPRARTDEP